MAIQYISFLRGINVGGKNSIKMSDIQSITKKCGYTNVSTYIQSGNILFETRQTDTQKISKTIENAILDALKIDAPVVTITRNQLESVVESAPAQWKSKSDIRRYIAFLYPPLTSEEAKKYVKINQDVDTLDTGKHVLYLTTILSGLTKSSFTQLIKTPIYKQMTIRNYNTIKKILLKYK